MGLIYMNEPIIVRTLGEIAWYAVNHPKQIIIFQPHGILPSKTFTSRQTIQ